MNPVRVLCLLLCFQLLLPAQLWAQTAPTSDTQTIIAEHPQTPAPAASMPSAANLDLTSTQRTFSVSDLPNFQPTNILVGGQARTIQHGDMLTAAEHIALQQVLNTGAQNLHVSDLGSAIGGTFALTPSIAQTISNLVVPSGVTAI
jgi:hypothetical protein